MKSFVISPNRQSPSRTRSRNFVLTLCRRGVIVFVCFYILLGFIKNIKYFFTLTPPRPHAFVSQPLQSGFNGNWVIYISAYCIFIQIPDFNLDFFTALAEYKLFSGLPSFGNFPHIEVPTFNIPNFKVL